MRLLLTRNLIKTIKIIKNRRNYCDKCREIDYNSLKVLFFGTDTFSLPSLRLLHHEWKNKRNIEKLEVVTSFRAVSNPVKEFAARENLRTFDFKEFKSQKHFNYDLGLVVSFGHMIPEKIIHSFPLGMLNVHASLLPKYRGAAPIIHAIRNGDDTTGVSIMKIEPKHFDIGDILLQKEIPINDTDFMPTLHDKLALDGAQLLIDCIKALPSSLLNARKQDETKASYAPKIDENFTHVRWDCMSAKDVFNLYRSLFSFKFPSTQWHGEPVKLKNVSYNEETCSAEMRLEPGTVRYSHKTQFLNVSCADGTVIQVESLGIGKKSKISAKDFNNGFLKKRPENERRFSS